MKYWVLFFFLMKIRDVWEDAQHFFNLLNYSANSNSYFFLLSFFLLLLDDFLKLCFQHVTNDTNDANVMCGCAHVCPDDVCAGLRVYTLVCPSVCRFVWVHIGEPKCARVCVHICGCAMGMGVHGYLWMCAGMCGTNSQNTYWRLDSQHQQIIIHILCEFYYILLKFYRPLVGPST